MSILRRIIVFAGVSSAALLMSGCATQINISEVMQKPKGTRYYLAHNVWSEGRKTISSINYQRGTIIPFGTEIKIINAEKSSITKNCFVKFKVVPTGHNYTIKYHEKYGISPLSDYVKQLITTQTKSEMTKDISSDFINAMTRGEVLPGMTRKEVIMTYGPPSPHRTTSQTNTTWIYWLRRWPVTRTSRVIFKEDKVLHVMK